MAAKGAYSGHHDFKPIEKGLATSGRLFARKIRSI